MTGLILFGTEGCHLCEEAEDLVVQAKLKVEKRDIMDDEDWQQRYGIRIPVLLNQASGRELGWPFSLEQLRQFVSHFD
ncbi:glutaredoxin family protein [Methylomonas methanica]|uniref:Glutaredoxin 2 n=1 Tax=Methylomonas methanica (strain DSM 25384 / MC09) TaxID=857087 RepID=G0A5K9_METMM|nr:glutaredoxin family protein [Methylomonas methanica]AEG02866.1 glutaredoxin 2 [Methylomonas methanica MC09]